jgi:hypothetical protein
MAFRARARVSERVTDRLGRNVLLYPNRRPARVVRPGPPILTNLAAWYDPSDLTAMTRTGQAVTALLDKSGNGMTLSVGSAVGEPLVAAQSVPQRLAIPHRAFATWSSNASLSDITMSAFIVACQTYSGAAARIFINPSTSGGFQWYIGAGGNLITDSAGTVNLGSTVATITLGTPFVAGVTLTQTACRQYINLVGETDTYGSTSFGTGRTMQVGAASWCGWTGEILLYSDTKTNIEAESIISYLMSKWGVGVIT